MLTLPHPRFDAILLSVNLRRRIVEEKKSQVHIEGIGSHQIDFKIVDEATKKRVIDCIHKNGRISVLIGGGVHKGLAGGGFEQLID